MTGLFCKDMKSADAIHFAVARTTLRPRATRAFIPRLAKAISLWRERVRQRRALAHLDSRMLRDIGITRLDVQRECEKPFWR